MKTIRFVFFIIAITVTFFCYFTQEGEGYGLTGFNWYDEIPFNGTGQIEYTLNWDNHPASITEAEWNGEIGNAYAQWAACSNLEFGEDTVWTDNDITFMWDPAIDGLAITRPVGGPNWGTDPTLSELEIAFNPNPNMPWSATGDGYTTYDLGTVAQHEIGHAIGLAHTNTPKENYKNENSVNHQNDLPVMAQGKHYGNGYDLTGDDIFGARWLYGSDEVAIGTNSDSLVNAAFEKIPAGDPNLFWLERTVDHSPPATPNTWIYQGNIGIPGPGGNSTQVILDAYNVTSAVALMDAAAWTAMVTPHDVTFEREGAYTGQFQFKITSPNPQGPMYWETFADGHEWGFTFGPLSVPEPTTLLLLSLGLIGIAGMRRRMHK